MPHGDAGELDFDAARALLGVNHRTLERWVRLGRLTPQRRPDGQVVFHRGEVMALRHATHAALRRPRP